MRVLVDTNIVLDFLLEREPFLQDAEQLFQRIGTGQVAAYVTATTLTDIFYIARRQTRDVEQARQAIEVALAVMEICPINRAVLESAFSSGIADFEDAVQIFAAVSQSIDAILTRDTSGFVSSPIPVLSIPLLIPILRTPFPEKIG